MKVKILTTVILLIFATVSWSQKFEDVQKIEADAEKVIRIANVNGSVEVQGGSESKVAVEAAKMVSARDPEEFAYARDKLNISYKTYGDTLLIFIEGLPSCACNENGNGDGHFNYSWDWDFDYDFNFDLKVSVPASSNLIASTINDGDINVKGVTGIMRIKNINGSITLDGIKSKVKASTINGDVDLQFAAPPVEFSKFYTLNGDINANFNDELNADVLFDSYNGEFYTNVDEVKQYQVTETTEYSEGKDGVKYKVGSKSKIQFRDGGAQIEFETFNGDVILKENSK